MRPATHSGCWRRSASRNTQATPEQGGPPLCVLEDFAYPVQRLQLASGDCFCLVTDGITEAASAAGDLYGNTRVRSARASVDAHDDADAVVRIVREDVARCVSGAEASDDMAVVVVQWLGPTAAPVPSP